MKYTDWKYYTQGNNWLRMRLMYGINPSNNSLMFHARTECMEQSRWIDMDLYNEHRTIAKMFPKYKSLVPLDGISIDTGMHYTFEEKRLLELWDIGLGRLDQVRGLDPWQEIKKTIACGLFDDDISWLQSRIDERLTAKSFLHHVEARQHNAITRVKQLVAAFNIEKDA